MGLSENARKLYGLPDEVEADECYVPYYYGGDKNSDVINFIKANKRRKELEGFIRGNIIKYALRAGDKTRNGIDDIGKIIVYAKRWIEILEEWENCDELPF